MKIQTRLQFAKNIRSELVIKTRNQNACFLFCLLLGEKYANFIFIPAGMT